MTSSVQFKLGEQPDWAGKEKNEIFDPSFVVDLLNESKSQSLINRGYCLVELDKNTRNYYDNFHTSCENFFTSSNKVKEYFAQLQFDPSLNSPNQCHGYSRVSTLKEQFMMRCIGSNLNCNYLDCLKTPSTSTTAKDENLDLGIIGMKLYEKLDIKCRELAGDVMNFYNYENGNEIVNNLLDPLPNNYDKKNECVVKRNGNYVYSSFMPNGYVSSSIIDNFHYYSPSKEKSKRFYNNHSSHTDSGLMTVVIVTDVPGLEIYDQKEDCWIDLESLIQQYLYKTRKNKRENNTHRNYAIIFWSDSVEYLNKYIKKQDNKYKLLKPCFHRVADCHKERISLVFKQRTAPLRTHCRYQEDYVLGDIQAKVDKTSKNAYALLNKNNYLGSNRSYLVDLLIAGSIIGSFVGYKYYKSYTNSTSYTDR